MNWLKKAILGAAASVVAFSAGAQEPARQPAVRLGTPRPLAVGSGPLHRAEGTSDRTNAVLQQASAEAPPAPRVVRAAGPILDDERSLFLPREAPVEDELKAPRTVTAPVVEESKSPRSSASPAAEESKSPRPAATPAAQESKLPRSIPAPAAQESKSLRPMAPPAPRFERISQPAKPMEQPRSTNVTHANGSPIVADSSRLLPTLHMKETIVILDEKGNPIYDSAFAGPGHFYGSAEYLLWWTRGFRLPPLVTTASPLDPERTRGALGFGSTRTIFGDDTTSSGPTSGGRFTLGYNLDPCGLCAIEGSFFFLGRNRDNSVFTSDAFPVLARPFFNINEGTQDRELVSSPGIVPGDIFKANGSIAVNTSSQLLGAELNLRRLCWCTCDYTVSGLVGFRYLNLRESLGITENIVILQDIPTAPPAVPIFAGDNVTVFDAFSTNNNFYGGQVGANAQWQRGRWTVDGTVKLAIGATVQSVNIDGGQEIVSRNGNRQTFAGGLYALPSNIGHHSHTSFSFVPEVGLKLGYDVSNKVRLFVGYDFLYWTNVMRPGDQIDQVLDVNQVPNSGGPFPAASQLRPRVPFQTSSFWAQGVSAGIMIRY